MSRRKCAACGNKANTFKRRLVLSPDGSMESALVCNPCAFGRSIQIVPLKRSTPCSLCKPGAEADAKCCLSCAKDVAEKAVKGAWLPYVKRIRKLAKAYALNDDGRAEGLTMAADMLERGGISLTEEGDGE